MTEICKNQEQRIIEVSDLYKCYWVGAMPFPALNGVDLRLQRGDFAVVAGRSGSGKSTLLNIIGALETSDRGTVRVCGQDIQAWNRDQRTAFRLQHVGFVFQAYNLIRVLTARENVAYICQLRGKGQTECTELADHWLSEVGIGYLGYRRPDQLSGGQQQRVAVARALAMNPDLVLADEPTANLDSKTGGELIDLMQRLNEKFRTTFVIASHDQAVIQAAGKLVNMEDGQVLVDGMTSPRRLPMELACPRQARPLRERILLSINDWRRRIGW